MPDFVDPSTPGDCLFCHIANGAIPSAKVYEDEQVLAIMDIGPVNPGHVLVLPKAHYRDLFDIPVETAQQVMAVAQQVAIAIRDEFSCPGLMLLQANGKAGAQTVFHYHMHVVPRHKGDGAGLVWPRQQTAGEALADYAALIAERLEQPLR